MARARSMIGYTPPPHPHSPPGWPKSPIRYRLAAGHNGGTDPYAPHPASWSFGFRTPTLDCSGFVAWCLGLDRYQPDSAVKWISTDGMIRDADGEQEYFSPIDRPELGAVVVYGSEWRDGRRIYVGHVGIVVCLPVRGWGPGHRQWSRLRVVHCSSGNDRRMGGAIQQTDASHWRGRGRLLRYLRAS